MTSAADRDVDPVELEVLRSRLEAITEEAGLAVERTAISPVVTEGQDYSATLTDGRGRLVAGGGVIALHWRAAAHAVRCTLARFGADAIRPGDVYLANDPHHGGGLHPQDVMVQRPVFVDGRLVAWAGLSAHLMDLGGMAAGSFAPAATECYQEALRLPPVQLVREGVEVDAVWDILRNNVRLATLVEMDLRALVAGSHVAAERLVDLAHAVGLDDLLTGADALIALTDRELRRRIAALEDGEYRATTWTEWDDELFCVPCALTVDGDRLVFDYEGAAAQAPHFFNTKPFIIESAIMTRLTALLAPDLPYNEGLFAPLELRCPEGSIVNSRPPAPIAAAHIHVALNAAEAALQCVRLALGASPRADGADHLSGWGGATALGLSTWSGTGLDGTPDGWIMLDGSWPGTSAGADRDGIDLAMSLVGSDTRSQFQDVEVLESWYPMLVTEKGPRAGVNGPGQFRSGSGCAMGFVPYGTETLSGEMLASRRFLPLEGAAGGSPGATTSLSIRRADGSSVELSTNAGGVALASGETFEFRCASGGGFGDPLDRDPAAVATDVAAGQLTVESAYEVYGVVFDAGAIVDHDATDAARRARRDDRLRIARHPAAPVDAPAVDDDADAVALYPGVAQHGAIARCVRTGAALAVAPAHWTDGCPVLEQTRPGPGPALVERSYLDPHDGRVLHTEVVPAGYPRAFAVFPKRWTEA